MGNTEEWLTPSSELLRHDQPHGKDNSEHGELLKRSRKKEAMVLLQRTRRRSLRGRD